MEPETIRNILMSVSAIAASLSSYSAVKSISISNKNRQDEIESKRPYFSFEEVALEIVKPPINHGNDKSPAQDHRHVQFAGILKNYGERPAINIEASCFLLPKEKGEGKEIPSALADDFPPGAEWRIQVGEHRIEHLNHIGYFLCLGIKYDDPITLKSYKQLFFMKWLGVKSGVVSGSVVGATAEEKKSIVLRNSFIISKYV